MRVGPRLSHAIDYRLLLLLAATTTPPVAAAQRAGVPASRCPDTIVVDFRARTIGGVPMDTTLARVTELLEPNSVTADTLYFEGQAFRVYVLDFCGHKVRRLGTAVSWTDAVFRTLEGLGTGSQVREFDRYYGEGQGTWGEGYLVRYGSPGGRIDVVVNASDNCFAPRDGKVQVNRSCAVTTVSLGLSRWWDRRPD